MIRGVLAGVAWLAGGLSLGVAVGAYLRRRDERTDYSQYDGYLHEGDDD